MANQITIATEYWHNDDGSVDFVDIHFSTTPAAHCYYTDDGFKLIHNNQIFATKTVAPKLDPLTDKVVVMGARCDVYFRLVDVKQ